MPQRFIACLMLLATVPLPALAGQQFPSYFDFQGRFLVAMSDADDGRL